MVGQDFCLLAVALIIAFVAAARWGRTAGVVHMLEGYYVSCPSARWPTLL